MATAKDIIVQSVVQAHYFTCQVPWACISIVTEEDSWPKISEVNRVGMPKDEDLPSTFSIEYVRAWKKAAQ